MTFSSAYQRRKNRDFFTIKFLKNVGHNFFLTEFHHAPARIIRESLTNACIQQTQKIVDFGNGSHCTARIAVSGFLFNGNDRAETRNLIYIRPLHIPDKLAGISTETFHVTPLTLGVNGIERKGRFSATADTGYDHQTVFWYGNIYILEIMHPGPENFNHFFPGHRKRTFFFNHVKMESLKIITIYVSACSRHCRKNNFLNFGDGLYLCSSSFTCLSRKAEGNGPVKP